MKKNVLETVLQFISSNALLLIIVLASLALVLLLLRIWRGRKKKYLLERDKSGFWRYHKETQFKKKDAFKEQVDKDKKKEKNKDKKTKGTKDKDADKKKKSIAVISFQGDIRAKQHVSFASLVDEIEVNAEEIEEVVVCVSSPGGMVAQYGHAFSQMERLRKLELKLTVCIDVVAASGGYLMSLPAEKIIAAPFAMVGSIGVMAFVPNVRKFLTNLDITPRTFTAGRYKRTITLTDDASPEEVARFQSQLETIHRLFSQAVAKYRTEINVEEITTGEHWTAQESIEQNLGLVDELGTSHEYLLKRNKNFDLIYLSQKRSFWDDGLGRFAAAIADQVENRLFSFSNGIA